MPSSRRPVLSSMPRARRLTPVVGVGVEHPVPVGVEQRANVVPEPGVGELEPDVDLPAAGEADLPGIAVGDAVVDGPRLATAEDRGGAGSDIGFDAAAGDRADDPSALADHHLRAGLARGGADRGDTVATAAFSPAAPAAAIASRMSRITGCFPG